MNVAQDIEIDPRSIGRPVWMHELREAAQRSCRRCACQTTAVVAIIERGKRIEKLCGRAIAELHYLCPGRVIETTDLRFFWRAGCAPEDWQGRKRFHASVVADQAHRDVVAFFQAWRDEVNESEVLRELVAEVERRAA